MYLFREISQSRPFDQISYSIFKLIILKISSKLRVGVFYSEILSQILTIFGEKFFTQISKSILGKGSLIHA